MKVKCYKYQIECAIIAIISFFSCFNNAFLIDHIPYIGSVQFILRISLCFLGAVILILKKNKLSSASNHIMLLFGIFLISTLLNNGNFYSSLIQFSYPMVICVVLEFYFKEPKKIESVLHIWSILMLFVVAIDLLTEIKYPNGLYSTNLYSLYWFLGYKTERAVYTFPLMVISTFLSIKKSGKIGFKTVCVYVLILADSFMSQGMTIFIAFLIVAFLIIALDHMYKDNLFIQKCIQTILNYKLVLLIYTIVTILVVAVENSQLVAVISAYFNKSAGISNRNVIWMHLIQALNQSPLIGLGYKTTKEYTLIGGFVYATNAHNAILTLMINGGIFAIIIYLFLHIKVLKKIENKIILCLSIFVYTNLLIGVTSAILVISSFSMLSIYLIEIERKTYSKL
nr:O-antigen ligase family protein [uncultured Faecalicatena sp.]